jgi:hypothetical protein
MREEIEIEIATVTNKAMKLWATSDKRRVTQRLVSAFRT